MTNLNKVNLSEGLKTARLLDIEDGNDILVVEVSEKLHLTECPQTKHGVVERGDFLDCHFLARGLVDGRTKAVRSIVRSTGRDPYQTTPYAPSPTTSWISYCSDTLNEIFREPGGGCWRDMVRKLCTAFAGQSNTS